MNKPIRKRQNVRVVGGTVMPLYMEPSQKAHNILATAMAKGYNQKGFVETALEELYESYQKKGVLPEITTSQPA